MILKDFIYNVCDDIQCFDDEFVEKLLRSKLSLIEDKVLGVTNFLTKTYKTIVPASLQVRLPYDMRYPKVVKVNGVARTRFEPNELSDNSTGVSIEAKRLNLSESIPLRLKPFNFEYVSIELLRSKEDSGYGFNLLSADGVTKLGEVFDRTNIYYPESLTDENIYPVKIKVLDSIDDVSYQDVVRYKDGDILTILTNYGIYNLPLVSTVKEYYLAENGFAYSDIDLTTLISRGNIATNNLILNFATIEEGDEVEVTYDATAQKYINENQTSIILDFFYDTVMKGAQFEGYKYMKKPQKANEAIGEFNESIKIIQLESGRFKSFGKKKFYHPTGSAPRLPI